MTGGVIQWTGPVTYGQDPVAFCIDTMWLVVTVAIIVGIMTRPDYCVVFTVTAYYSNRYIGPIR